MLGIELVAVGYACLERLAHYGGIQEVSGICTILYHSAARDCTFEDPFEERNHAWKLGGSNDLDDCMTRIFVAMRGSGSLPLDRNNTAHRVHLRCL